MCEANSHPFTVGGIVLCHNGTFKGGIGAFSTIVQSQLLRPFPQYQNIQTGPQNGDKSGHSSYHSMLLKFSRRFSSGLALEWNYVLSKLLTTTDSRNPGNSTQDQYNRSLEKSIGQFDVTHNLKFSAVWEVPVGKGRRFGVNKALDYVVGGWRVSGIATYASGQPLALGIDVAFGKLVGEMVAPQHHHMLASGCHASSSPSLRCTEVNVPHSWAT